jgi:hypothetical protein
MFADNALVLQYGSGNFRRLLVPLLDIDRKIFVCELNISIDWVALDSFWLYIKLFIQLTFQKFKQLCGALYVINIPHGWL